MVNINAGLASSRAQCRPSPPGGFLEGRGVCLAARASIPRVLHLSARRSRGEATGGIQTLIGTPERFF